MDTTDISLLREKIGAAQRIAIVPHKNPDGDAIGSSLGIWHYLKSLGKDAAVMVQDPIPYFLEFLPGSDQIIVNERNPEIVASRIAQCDVLISMDYCQASRSGDIEPLLLGSKAFKVMVDHHPGPDQGYNFYYHEVAASSTSELTYLLIQALDPGYTITREIGTCLYTGLLTDTGCFKYALRPETFRVAGELLKAGISVEHITSSVFDVNTPERLKLLGFALNDRMVILPEYRTAYIALSNEDMERFNIRSGDTEGIVNYTLSVKNILFGALFTEKEAGQTKISLRSKGNFAVNEVSGKYFNGGGHKNAAGGKVDIPAEDVVKKFLEILPQYKDELNS